MEENEVNRNTIHAGFFRGRGSVSAPILAMDLSNGL